MSQETPSLEFNPDKELYKLPVTRMEMWRLLSELRMLSMQSFAAGYKLANKEPDADKVYQEMMTRFRDIRRRTNALVDPALAASVAADER